ncbi:MAG: hypothetical protein Q9227_002477 [Pyrenula ochraceoflavens]
MPEQFMQPGIVDFEVENITVKTEGLMASARGEAYSHGGAIAKSSTKRKSPKKPGNSSSSEPKAKSSPTKTNAKPTAPLFMNRKNNVIAIDFGTTFTGVAYSFGGADVQVIKDWAGGNDIFEKVATRIAFHCENSDLDRDKFGYEVEPGTLQVAWFKLLLDKDTKQTEFDDGYLQDFGRLRIPEDMTAKQVVVVFLRYIYEHVMAHLSKVLPPRVLEESPIQYWFTVPANWSLAASSKTREAALEAGFGNREGDNLELIREPEAASIAILAPKADQGLYQAGNHVLVVDLGGGTTDLTLFKLTSLVPLAMDEPVSGVSGKYASTTIDRGLKKRLGEIFGAAFTDLHISKTDPGSDLMEKFEAIKKKFDGSNLGKKWKLPLVALGTALKTQDPECPHYIFSDGDVQIDGKLIADLFDEVIEKALELVENQRLALKQAKGNKAAINAIVLCGGLGTSKYVWEKFKSYCRVTYKDDAILQTDAHAWSAVVRGAAIRGLEGKVVKSRIARLWYGIGAHHEFREGYDNDEDAFDCPTRGKRAHGYFDCLMKRGQRFTDNMKKTTKVYVDTDPSSERQIFTWKLYSSGQDQEPERISEAGMLSNRE